MTGDTAESASEGYQEYRSCPEFDSTFAWRAPNIDGQRDECPHCGTDLMENGYHV